MKPLLAVAVEEAFRIAVADSVPDATDERRRVILLDVYAITAEEWAGVRPTRLAQNLVLRLLAPGCWTVRGVYAGNASPAEVFDSCVLARRSKAADVVDVFEAAGMLARTVDSVEDLRQFEEETKPKGEEDAGS